MTGLSRFIASPPSSAPPAGCCAFAILFRRLGSPSPRLPVYLFAILVKGVRLFEKRGDQIDAGLQVVLVDGFDDRVDVASRDRNGNHRCASTRALDAAGVRAAARQNLQLMA